MAFDLVTNSSLAVPLFTTNNPLPALPTVSEYNITLLATAVGGLAVSNDCNCTLNPLVIKLPPNLGLVSCTTAVIPEVDDVAILENVALLPESVVVSSQLS